MGTTNIILLKSAFYKFYFVIAILVLLFSCKTVAKIENGQTAYDLKQYSVAIDMLDEEIKQENDAVKKAEMAFLIGDSYKQIQDIKRSRDWFERSVKSSSSKKNLLALAYAEKQLENYPEAIRQFKKVEKIIGSNALVTREIRICEQASLYLENEKSSFKTEVKPLSINAETSEYSPQIFNQDYLVITSDRSEARGEEVYKWSGQDFTDLFLLNKRGGGVTSFNASINTDANEGTACFTKDYTQMYFTRCFSTATEVESEVGDAYCKIMLSRLEDNQWQIPEPLPFLNDGVNYGHPALIENDSILLFTAEDINGATGFDIYYSVLTESGWSTPLAMPKSINTQGNEKFPTADGDTLYFSSDYLPGLGGLDIFKTYLINNERWAPPVNVKAPINSGADDFGFIVDRTGVRRSGQVIEEGFFSSNRVAGNRDDIYSYQKVRTIENPQDSIIETPEAELDFNIYLAVKTVETVHEIKGDPSSPIIDKIPLPNIGLSLIVASDTSKFRTDEKARLIEELRKDKSYKIIAKSPNYLSASSIVATKDLQVAPDESSVTINVELALDPIVFNQEITLTDIYYDFDKWNIREDARPSLDKLAKIMLENEELNIQLSSHTDCRGNNAFNQNLSQKRAESASNYLGDKGVSLRRIIPVGYGESLLIEQCECDDCNEKQHQSNRRTTFKILK